MAWSTAIRCDSWRSSCQPAYHAYLAAKQPARSFGLNASLFHLARPTIYLFAKPISELSR